MVDRITNVGTDISIHTPHARRDLLIAMIILLDTTFQSTRLMRGVTNRPITFKGEYYDFNPHASCEA